jgi:hypothetical protein
MARMVLNRQEEGRLRLAGRQAGWLAGWQAGWKEVAIPQPPPLGHREVMTLA